MIDLIPKDQLVDLLRKCREQFAFYERNHRTKAEGFAKTAAEYEEVASGTGGGTSPKSREWRKHEADTLAKADVNGQMVKQIDALIGPPPGAKLPDDLAETREAS